MRRMGNPAAYPPPGFDLVNAIERVSDHQLHEVLKDRIWNRDVVPGFDDELIRTITRPEVRNYNGKHVAKRPDMVVELVDIPDRVRPSQYGIFIECKPVDAKHSLVSHYCKLGIRRFVRGDYAWAMTQAMMIGYVDSAGLPAERLAVAAHPSQKGFANRRTNDLCSFSGATARGDQRTSPGFYLRRERPGGPADHSASSVVAKKLRLQMTWAIGDWAWNIASTSRAA